MARRVGIRRAPERGGGRHLRWARQLAAPRKMSKGAPGGPPGDGTGRRTYDDAGGAAGLGPSDKPFAESGFWSVDVHGGQISAHNVPPVGMRFVPKGVWRGWGCMTNRPRASSACLHCPSSPSTAWRVEAGEAPATGPPGSWSVWNARVARKIQPTHPPPSTGQGRRSSVAGTYRKGVGLVQGAPRWCRGKGGSLSAGRSRRRGPHRRGKGPHGCERTKKR